MRLTSTMSSILELHTLTPRPTRRHPLRESTLPTSHAPVLSTFEDTATPRAAPNVAHTRPRLTPILTSLSPFNLLDADAEDDSHTAIPRPAITSITPISPAVTMSPVSPTGMPTPAPASSLDTNPYISPSNPISRFALPTFSPRGYSAFDSTVPKRSSKLSPNVSPRTTQIQLGVKRRLRMPPKGMQSAMRQRTAMFASPAVLHLGTGHSDPLDEGLVRSLQASPIFGEFGHDSGSYSMKTCPLDIPFPLAPSPTLIPPSYASAARNGPSSSRRSSVLRYILPRQRVAFVRAHLSLLLYVALGMLISLTLLTNDPAVRLGLGLGQRRGAGQVVDLAVPTMPVHHSGIGQVRVSSGGGAGESVFKAHGRGSRERSRMGVWADYADARTNREGRDWLSVFVSR